MKPVYPTLAFALMGFFFPAAAVAEVYSFTTLSGVADDAISIAARDARFATLSGIASDSSGNIYLADAGAHVIRKVSPSGVATRLAGRTGVAGSTDGAGSAALFNKPSRLAIDGAGNLYVADTGNHTIRRVSSSGVVTTLAGVAGETGSADGGGSQARFNSPSGIAIAANGAIFVADAENKTIRRITISGQVSTFAGQSGVSANLDGQGPTAAFSYPSDIAIAVSGVITVIDGSDSIRRISETGAVSTLAKFFGNFVTDGPLATARFNSPAGIAADAAGNVYIAERQGCVIRKISINGIVSTIAGAANTYGTSDGPGGTARFMVLDAIATDSSGSLVVADRGAATVRRVSAAGAVTTIAGRGGSDDGPLSSARFFDITAVTGDAAGNLYVLERLEHVVRKINASGVVSTLAGSAGASGRADGIGSAARFNLPGGIAVEANGVVYVTDTENHAIRRISPDGVVMTLAGLAGTPGAVNGSGATARFNRPMGIALAPNGDLMVADNHAIRRITPSGDVTTYAGALAVSGSANGTLATARFAFPLEVAVDRAGDVYVHESVSRRIRRISTAGTVSNFVSGFDIGIRDGVVPSFEWPVGLVTDAFGNVLIAESPAATVRRISPEGIVITVAGSTLGIADNDTVPRDGTGREAQFAPLTFIGTDPTGNIYTGSGRFLHKGVRRETSALSNLSLRCVAGEGAGVPIAGYSAQVMLGTAFLVRGLGPALRPFGVTNAIADPKLRFYRGSEFVFEIDNWTGTRPAAVANRVGAFGLVTGSLDAASVGDAVDTQTIQLTGGTGVGLIEIYDAGGSDYARLTNLSGRAFVGTGGDILIAGFAISGDRPRTVLIRAIGPTLGSFGVAGALVNPKLELFSGTRRIAENDDWGGGANLHDGFTRVGAFALDPASRDAALLVTLEPGAYSAQVSGVNSATGVALVEVYDVP